MIKLRIRTASSDSAQEELDKILLFYKSNWNNFNAPRDPEILFKAIKNGRAFIVDDITDSKDIRIMGVSFIITEENALYTEGGGTRIVLEGYRLQSVVNYAKIMHEFILDPPKREFYSIVADSNKRSGQNLLLIGFEKWNPDDDLLATMPGKSFAGKSFYRVPKSNLNKIRDKFLDIVDGGTLLGKPPLEAVSIEFSLIILRYRFLTRKTDFS